MLPVLQTWLQFLGSETILCRHIITQNYERQGRWGKVRKKNEEERPSKSQHENLGLIAKFRRMNEKQSLNFLLQWRKGNLLFKDTGAHVIIWFNYHFSFEQSCSQSLKSNKGVMDAGEGHGSFRTARLESSWTEEQISLACRGSHLLKFHWKKQKDRDREFWPWLIA